MQRFAFFVDGSNVFGSLKSMHLEVHDYEQFYGYIYAEAAQLWRTATHSPVGYPTQLRRIYWYAVGSLDDWDLALPQSQAALRKAFDSDKDIRAAWHASASKGDPSLSGTALSDKAWADCFSDFRTWYEGKQSVLDNMRRFHQGVRLGTDLIDIIEDGHWKVNFIRKWVEEKGLDTSLAVDMIARADNFDVAVILTGDADSIPSIRYLKNLNKHVCAVEFVSGSPPESKGRNFSSRVKLHADFVVRIYETELLRHKHAKRPLPGT